jgi:hypothetical protein
MTERVDKTSAARPPAQATYSARPSYSTQAVLATEDTPSGPLGRLWKWVRDDGAGAGLSARWTWILTWLPIIGGVPLAATLVHKPLYYALLSEDHSVEWVQFACLFFATLAASVATVRAARNGHLLLAAVFAVFALGAFALGGEEISWGQRVFGVVEPASLSDVNHQSELNLHNINKGPVNFEELAIYVECAMSAVLAGLSLVLRRHGRAPRVTSLGFMLAPPVCFVPSLAFSALFPLLILFPTLGALRTVWAFQEWSELCRYLTLAVMAAIAAAAHRRVATTRRHVAASGLTLAEPVLVTIALAVTVVTVIFSIMTLFSGIAPIDS